MNNHSYLKKNSFHEGDARELLKCIEEESIALSVWSPPYHVGKKYEEGQTYEQWSSLLTKVIALHYPILKPGGFLVINIDDILAFPDPRMPRFQAVNLKKHRVSVTREDILNALKLEPELTKYQLAKKFNCSEQTIERRLKGNNIRGGKYNVQTKVKLAGPVLEKAAEEAGLYLYDRRIWAKDPAWQNSQWHSNSYKAVSEFEHLYIFWKPGETVIDRNKLSKEEWASWASRGIWYIPSVRKNDDHEAKFPLLLPQRLIKLLTQKGDTVLDCFMGSGTTAVAALSESRNFIGIEKEPKYIQLSNKNVETFYISRNKEASKIKETNHSVTDEKKKAEQLELLLEENENSL